MKKMINQTFHETFSTLLESNLELTRKTHDLSKINTYSCLKIYETIFNTLTNILQEAGVKISNDAANYVAQQYYDGTLINARYELDPEIFTKRAKLEEISTPDLIKVAAILRGTDFLAPVVLAIKNRN